MTEQQLHETSPAQFRAVADGVLPAPEWVRDDVLSIAQEMPGGHISHSLCSVILDVDGHAHVIDPGWASDANEQRIFDALAQRKLDAADIRSVMTTHLHPDHAGLLRRIAQRSGAPVVATRREQVAAESMDTGIPSDLVSRLDHWGVPASRRTEFTDFQAPRGVAETLSADILLDDGDTLPIPGSTLTVILTPGHTPGHMCLVDEGRGIIHTGDHVLPTMHSGLGLGGATQTNPLTDYLSSLAKVEPYDHLEVLPGHGYRFRGLRARVDAHRHHHLRRANEVAEVLRTDPAATTWEVARALTWTAGWDRLVGFYLYSALMQTEMHRDYALTELV